MTCVAWDGRTLAADRMVTFGGTPMRHPGKKIHRLIAPNGRVALVGFAGSETFAVAFRNWMLGGDKPEFKIPDNIGWVVLLVDDEGGVWNRGMNHDAWTLLGRRVNWAIGSGCDYALGAMAMGATARQAVAIASNLDNCTGMGIDTVRF